MSTSTSTSTSASTTTPAAAPERARPRIPARRAPWIVALALLAILAWLVARSLGLTPSVFADELYYSRMARLQPLEQAMVPSYLYLWLFGASRLCGDGFLDCARAANALLFVAGSPFLYLAARQAASRLAAAAIAVLAALAPLNAFSAYFMPEPMYYFGFCVLSWMLVACRAWPRKRHALASGLVLGLMSLVKVHAVFLLPALCLYLAWLCRAEGGAWARRALAAMALAALAAFAVRFGLGWLLAGKAALSLFGPFYGGAADGAGGRSPWRLLAPFLVSARGHLMALAVLDALPLAVLLHGLLAALLDRRLRVRNDAGALLRAWTLLALASAAGMTVLYTATLAAPGVNDEGLRLHLRYYSFAFPLLWTVAACAPQAPGRRRQSPARWLCALLLLAVLGAALARLPTYAFNIVDGPDIFAVRLDTPAGIAIVLLQGAILLLWASGVARARQLFLFVALPATLACGIAANGAFLREHAQLLPADKAGQAAHRLVPAAERASLVIAGTDYQQLMRALFHVDHPGARMLELPAGAPLASYQVPVRERWLLVFGPHALPPGLAPLAGDADFALVRLDGARRVLGGARLNTPFGQGLIAGAEGLSHAEEFGRWSEAKRVVLHLNLTLPRRVKVMIKGMPYGDNSQLPFVLRIGDASAVFRLTGGMQEVGLDLETDGRQRSIVIEVPHPVSPQEYGDPRDARKLGLALAEIEVATPEP